jgi:hypothetical protein
VVYYRNTGYRVSALEGFTVQGGGDYTGGNPFHQDLTNRFGGRGGGIYCRVSGPVIAHNLIRSNSLGSPFNTFESYGGGLYVYLSHAEITGNTFTENEVLTQGDGNGGGIYCLNSMVNIEENIFRHNHALDGAAIYGNYSSLRVARNLVQSNALYNLYPLPTYMGSGDGAMTFWFARDLLVEANAIQGNVADSGAGLCLLSPFAARLQNNLILDNLAWDYSGSSGGQGGGIYCDVGVNATGTVIIANNTIVGNNAPPTFLGHFGGGIAATLYTNGLIVANNIIASNSSGIWRYPYLSYQPALQNNCLNNTNANNYVNLSAGTGDIQADPQFVNRAAGDFHLLSSSPCIEAGTSANAPTSDFDGVVRPLDGNANGIAAFDMGAFEFIHPLADTDGDSLRDTAEVIAGTDPTDAGSALRLSVQMLSVENSVALRWPSVAGRSYTIEYQPLASPTENWQTAISNLAGSGATLEWRDPTARVTSRFYRLGVRRD